ncbi:MAG: hypothetical protein ACTSW1_08140 [Candidatus Hodarchaeales archaeon]
MALKNETNRRQLQLISIVGILIACILFLVSLSYMTGAIAFDSIGDLAGTVFFGLLGTTAFISSTLLFLKS